MKKYIKNKFKNFLQGIMQEFFQRCQLVTQQKTENNPFASLREQSQSLC